MSTTYRDALDYMAGLMGDPDQNRYTDDILKPMLLQGILALVNIPETPPSDYRGLIKSAHDLPVEQGFDLNTDLFIDRDVSILKILKIWSDPVNDTHQTTLVRYFQKTPDEISRIDTMMPSTYDVYWWQTGNLLNWRYQGEGLITPPRFSIVYLLNPTIPSDLTDPMEETYSTAFAYSSANLAVEKLRERIRME